MLRILLVLLGLTPILASTQPLRFELQFEQPRYQAGKSVWARFLLRNLSDQPVAVNRRFLVNGPAPLDHDVVLEVTGPGGWIPMGLLVHAAPLMQRDFQVVPPHHACLESYDVAYAFGLRQAGLYQIQAVYENADPRGWVGKLLSGRVEVRLD